MKPYLLSVVIPVYNESMILFQNVSKIHTVLEENQIHIEMILVDDGSLDDTWSMILKLCEKYSNVYGVRLSRNFGKESAICAGLEEVSGDCCVLMDCDLQHPPEYIPQMIDKWKEGYEIIEAVKIKRGKEPLLNKFGAWLFYKTLSKFSGINLENASDFRLLDKKVLLAWKQMPEKNTFFRAMSTWVGFHRFKLDFELSERSSGKTKWSLFHLFRLATNAITAFSSLPLQIVTFLGFLFFFISFVIGIQTLYMKFMGYSNQGFTTVILLILIVGSILMISLGIIGVYISRIYDEVKARPRFFIAKRTKENKI